MTDREKIMSRLSRLINAPREPIQSALTKEGTWSEFTQQFEANHGTIWPAGRREALSQLALIDQDVPRDIAQLFENQTSDVWAADIGVTMVDALISETGSILICESPSRRRLASIVPGHHLCVVRDEQIVVTLTDALRMIGGRNAVLISGPSRTADIEGIMILGIHGPRTVTVAKVSDFD